MQQAPPWKVSDISVTQYKRNCIPYLIKCVSKLFYIRLVLRNTSFLIICLYVFRGGEGQKGVRPRQAGLLGSSHKSLFSTSDQVPDSAVLRFQELIYAVSKDQL